MPKPENGEMFFSPWGGLGVKIRTPEELAQRYFEIAPKAMIRTWGPDAAERYKQAVRERDAKISPQK